MGEQLLPGGIVDDPGKIEAAPEVKSREAREYVVLVRELRLVPGDPVSEPEAGAVDGRGAWGELGRVEAFNRAGAMEQVEERWPSALEGTPCLHLIPARFWAEVTPESAPPPPPKRKWKGV